MALDPPIDDGRVQTANDTVSASIGSENKYIRRINIHVHGKTTFIFLTLQTRLDSRNGCLTSEGGGRQQSFTQSAPNELKLGGGGDKVVRAGHRLGGGVGG